MKLFKKIYNCKAKIDYNNVDIVKFLSESLNRYKKIKPLYNFKTSGGTTHSLWKVDNDKVINTPKAKEDSSSSTN